MNATNNAPILKNALTGIAMAFVATMGIIATGTVNEPLLDSIQSW